MKIIRYQDNSESVGYAVLQANGKLLKINGDLFGQYKITGESIGDHTLLAPVAPPMIICIGANYNLHAKESGTHFRRGPGCL